MSFWDSRKNVKELLRELQNDKTPSSSDKYSYNFIQEEMSFWGSRNSRFNVKELLRELQNDKTPSSSDKYLYNLIYVKVSFWDPLQCEGVTSRASKWQNSE